MRKFACILVLCCAFSSAHSGAAFVDNKLPRIYNFMHLAECLEAFRDREFFEWIYNYANTDRTPELQFMTGLLYHRGLGVERNHAEAARWYRKASESGYDFRPFLGREADAGLRELIENGLHDPATTPSPGPEALLEERLAPKTAQEMRRLAMRYYYGLCAPLDLERSDLWEKRAALQEKKEAVQRLNEAVKAHRSGEAVDKEQTAREMMEIMRGSDAFATEAPSRPGGQTLAEYAQEIFDEGRRRYDAGDYYTAALRFSEASGFGIENPLCYFLLGDIQEKGLCGLPNPHGAGKNYRLAAELKHAESMSRLAALHEEGRGVRRSLAEARKWYAAARDAGMAGLADALVRVERKQVGRQREDWEESPEYRRVLRDAQFRAYFNHSPYRLPDEMRIATNCLFKAADDNQPYAQYIAGLLLLEGDAAIGLSADTRRGYHYLQQAAQAGVAQAEDKLGHK